MNIITLVCTWHETNAGFIVVLEHGSGDHAPVSGRCNPDKMPTLLATDHYYMDPKSRQQLAKKQLNCLNSFHQITQSTLIFLIYKYMVVRIFQKSEQIWRKLDYQASIHCCCYCCCKSCTM